ncbi:nucleotidyltransferase domain-containing protein [Methanococcoides sp. SA1]|nr:nucleotidyltransferase domain-containing protein [Methanococcoides sp. SA1]
MEFKVFIEKNPLARKVFGKKEIVIIRKQVSGVNLTQSEKNRLSRDIRPKLRFIREVSKFEGEFDLKKGSENKKILREALEVIKRDKDFGKVKAVWLFGSMIKNEMSVRSDIDVCVVFDRISLKDATKFRVRVLGKVNSKIDVQVLSKLPEKVKKTVLKSHRVLYKRDG